jgi:hypothetical protein
MRTTELTDQERKDIQLTAIAKKVEQAETKYIPDGYVNEVDGQREMLVIAGLAQETIYWAYLCTTLLQAMQQATGELNTGRLMPTTQVMLTVMNKARFTIQGAAEQVARESIELGLSPAPQSPKETIQ